LLEFLVLVIGGMLVVGSSNAFNQIWERDRDALMHRTKNRPLPAGRMQLGHAWAVALITGVLGLVALFWLNPLTGAFGALSIALYVLVYTPLKAVTPWAVLVGAFPGAIPTMLGWVAATGRFGIEPGVLFALQFVWQFPHFWAIAWMGFDDYARAGYYLLPSRKKDRSATYGSFVYAAFMVAISLLPASGLTGALKLSWLGAVLVLGAGVWVVWAALRMHREPSDPQARKLMLTTIGYLTLVQIIYVIDHFFLHGTVGFLFRR
jgi:protoheme IX farnesyltransferase